MYEVGVRADSKSDCHTAVRSYCGDVMDEWRARPGTIAAQGAPRTAARASDIARSCQRNPQQVRRSHARSVPLHGCCSVGPTRGRAERYVFHATRCSFAGFVVPSQVSLFRRRFRRLEHSDRNHTCSKYIVARLAFLTASPRAKFRSCPSRAASKLDMLNPLPGSTDTTKTVGERGS
jgi:hypothetical protein